MESSTGLGLGHGEETGKYFRPYRKENETYYRVSDMERTWKLLNYLGLYRGYCRDPFFHSLPTTSRIHNRCRGPTYSHFLGRTQRLACGNALENGLDIQGGMQESACKLKHRT